MKGEKKEEKRERKRCGEECRAVLERGAQALMGELGKLKPGIIDFLSGELYAGVSAWKIAPSGRSREFVLGWKMLLSPVGSFHAPDVKEFEKDIEAALREMGGSDGQENLR